MTRQKNLIILLGITLIGTLMQISSDIYSPSMTAIAHDFGASFGQVQWRSIFRDRFAGPELARIGSYLLNIIILSIILAPIIGGYIQHYLGWRTTFAELTGWIVFVALFVSFIFKETSQHHSLAKLNFRFMMKAYIELLTQREFIGFTLIVFLAYGGLFAWITGGPIVLMHGVGVSSITFGYLMIASGVSSGVGGWLNAQLLKRFSLKIASNFGYGLMALAGLSMLISYKLVGLNIYVVLIPAVIFILGSTIIFMNGFAMAFDGAGHIAGYAGSLYATIQQLGGAVFGAILGHLNTHSPAPMAIMFMVSGVVAWLLAKIVNK